LELPSVVLAGAEDSGNSICKRWIAAGDRGGSSNSRLITGFGHVTTRGATVEQPVSQSSISTGSHPSTLHHSQMVQRGRITGFQLGKGLSVCSRGGRGGGLVRGLLRVPLLLPLKILMSDSRKIGRSQEDRRQNDLIDDCHACNARQKIPTAPSSLNVA
jgi:hypothetical protein